MSIVTDSTLRAMLEQLHAALSDDDVKGARVWAALTADNFAEVQVGDFFNHSRYRFAVLCKNSTKIVGVGTYIGGDLEITRYEVNLVGGVLQTPVMTKLASLADLEDLKRGEFSSLTASNFADVKVGDKVINGICIYKTSVACVVYTGYQKLIQYELANGVVTPYEMTVPEKGEVAALKTAVNGKWDKPVSYGDANPITPKNFHSVKPGDYLYGTMCVRGSNGGTELHFAGSGTYRKVHLEDSDELEDMLMYDGKKVRHEYGVLATTTQVNVKADKTALDALKTEVEELPVPKVVSYADNSASLQYATVKAGDILNVNGGLYVVASNSGSRIDAYMGRRGVVISLTGAKAVISKYELYQWASVTDGGWDRILPGDYIVGNAGTVVSKTGDSVGSVIKVFNGERLYEYTRKATTGSGMSSMTVKTIQFA